MTTNRNDNQFFEVRLHIYAGSNERKAFDRDALTHMGFNEVDFDSIRAVLNTDVLPAEAFHPFLRIRKAVQEYLASKGQTHPLMGRVFNPQERVEIVEFLRNKQSEYEQAKQDFVVNYSAYIQQQLEKVEKSANLKGLDPAPLIKAVRNSQPKVEYYQRKMEFSFLDLSIELDSEQWQEVIDKINSDLIEKTVYELGRDASEIRDIENPRTRAKKLLELANRLRSLNFYVNGLDSLATKIESAVNSFGGVKPAKDYSQRETLALSGIGAVLDRNAANLVKKADFDVLFDAETKRIEALLAEDEDQMAIEETEADVQPVSESHKVESKPKPVPAKESVEQTVEVAVPNVTATTMNYGTFAF